ncbi:MAG: kelch repeat-containing protein [Planctomycetota bacterium]
MTVPRLATERIRVRILFHAMIAPFAVPAAAQQFPGWEDLGIAGPVARVGHGMVFDLARNEAVLFGGITGGSAATMQTILGDTWVLADAEWSQRLTPGPVARTEFGLAYDSQRGRTVLFGGRGATSLVLGDTWEWNGTNWIPAFGATATPRSNMGMCYDSARSCVVMFGGVDAGPAPLGDTWTWDGQSWIQVATTGPARQSPSMAFDESLGLTIMFGGGDGIGASLPRDTWGWNGSVWAQLSAAGPLGRVLHAMAFDQQRSVVLMWGGLAPGGTQAQSTETLEWRSGSWWPVAATGSAGSLSARMAYDPGRRRMLHFGGEALVNGNWIVSSQTWSTRAAAARSFGTGCGSPPLEILALSQPHMGESQLTELRNAPSASAALVLGFSNTTIGAFPLPAPLDGLGMTGCTAYHDAAHPQLLPFPTVVQGVAQQSIFVPNDPVLLNAHVYMQGMALAPAANPFGLLVSNAIEWRIGY